MVLLSAFTLTLKSKTKRGDLSRWLSPPGPHAPDSRLQRSQKSCSHQSNTRAFTDSHSTLTVDRACISYHSDECLSIKMCAPLSASSSTFRFSHQIELHVRVEANPDRRVRRTQTMRNVPFGPSAQVNIPTSNKEQLCEAQSHDSYHRAVAATKATRT